MGVASQVDRALRCRQSFLKMKLFAFALCLFTVAGVRAGFCPTEIDSIYQGFRANGRCVTLIDQDMITKDDMKTLSYNLAHINCSKYFTNGHLFAFKAAILPDIDPENRSNLLYDFLHVLPPAKTWKVYRNTRLINGVKLTRVDSFTQGQLIHANLHFEYSNGTHEEMVIKMSHGYNIVPSGYHVGIDLKEQPFLATSSLRKQICFTVNFPLSKRTASRQYSMNEPRECFSVNTFNAYLCESDPFDWCTIREVDPNGKDKMCQCAKGKKKAHCSLIPCKKSESWKGGKDAKCISPELEEVEEEAQIDMTKWYIIYGSITFLIIVVCIGIAVLAHRRKLKRKAKAAKIQEAGGEKKNTSAANIQVALESNMSSKKAASSKSSPASTPVKSTGSSRSPSPANK
uniref:EGF-like domain-containing protein n=1 Tax=Trichuris muris TaxID=70415 RepID=A0A5S6QPU0_TRIMR